MGFCSGNSPYDFLHFSFNLCPGTPQRLKVSEALPDAVVGRKKTNKKDDKTLPSKRYNTEVICWSFGPSCVIFLHWQARVNALQLFKTMEITHTHTAASHLSHCNSAFVNVRGPSPQNGTVGGRCPYCEHAHLPFTLCIVLPFLPLLFPFLSSVPWFSISRWPLLSFRLFSQAKAKP